MTSSPTPSPADPPLDEELGRLSNRDLADLLTVTDEIGVRLIAAIALERLADSESAVLRVVTPDGAASHVAIAARAQFEPVFIPPNRLLRHATPAVILTLSGPAASWSTKVVLQVLPDVTDPDVPYRFARAVQTARALTP